MVRLKVLDDNGAVRYNDKADPLSVDELVGDFLTANPHFVRASQGGAGTQGMAGGSTQKPISVADMGSKLERRRARSLSCVKEESQINHFDIGLLIWLLQLAQPLTTCLRISSLRHDSLLKKNP